MISSNGHLSSSYYNMQVHEHRDWENIVIPQPYQPVYNPMNYGMSSYTANQIARHRMSFIIKNLLPATKYEARVQARNDYGWNKMSNVFHFETRTEGKK